VFSARFNPGQPQFESIGNTNQYFWTYPVKFYASGGDVINAQVNSLANLTFGGEMSITGYYVPAQ
jgi:hypothetical protein